MSPHMVRALAEQMRRQDVLDELFRRFDADEPLTPVIDEFLAAGMDERVPAIGRAA